MNAGPGGSSHLSLDRIFADVAEKSAEASCIAVPGGQTVSYGAIDRRASAFAEVLRGRGARPGDRLMLAGCNTPDFFAALAGASRAGLVAVPVDAGLGPLELANVVAHARPHAIVVDRRVAQAFESVDAPTVALEEGAVPTWYDLDRLPAGAPLDPASRPEAALMLYTSGTTGQPKAAVHGHAGLLSKADSISGWFGMDSATRTLCLLPTHFGHGLVACCLSTFRAGGTVILCPPFDVSLLQRLWQLVDEHQVHLFSTVPSIVRLLLRFAASDPRPRGRAPQSLRFVTCASAPLHPDEAEAFEARFGIPLLSCYGITEGGTWCAMSPPRGERDRRSVGTAYGCRMRAVDGEGRELPAGETGEIQICGPSVMLGYDDLPEATARVLSDDGWLSTGDLGHVDAAGRLYLAGRKKELIIRSGVNVYPAEVEAVVMSHPGVAEAYVVGLEHPILGEKVGACVVRQPGSLVSREELILHCRGQLAHYKCPEEVRFVDAVPKTSRGKVSRASLKSIFGGN
jgi:long-chain acyl-CoA synthetase